MGWIKESIPQRSAQQTGQPIHRIAKGREDAVGSIQRS